MMKPRMTTMSHWMRTGRLLSQTLLEHKFNANHDPKNGQFTNAPSGPKSVSKSAPKATAKPKENPIDSKKIGRITVAQASNILTNETNGLSGGLPGDLANAKIALANVIVNGQLSSRPPTLAPDTLSTQAALSSGREDDQNIMRQVYASRSSKQTDPVNGALYYGTSSDIINSRPIGSGRQNVVQSFGPFDHGRGAQQYVYIYGPPYFPKKKK